MATGNVTICRCIERRRRIERVRGRGSKMRSNVTIMPRQTIGKQKVGGGGGALIDGDVPGG
jgi:hypothetical protein